MFSFKNNGKNGFAEKEPDYRLFFRSGLVLIIMGFICLAITFFSELPLTTLIPIFTLGIIYTAIGWGKRGTWKNN